MNDPHHPVYLGSILLEPNRWPDRPEATYSRLRQLTRIAQGPPFIQVSNWLQRAKADGFDGVELWENHALLCSDAEFAKLCQPALPMAVPGRAPRNADPDGPHGPSARVDADLHRGGVMIAGRPAIRRQALAPHPTPDWNGKDGRR